MLLNACKTLLTCLLVVFFSFAALANTDPPETAWSIIKEKHFSGRTIHHDAKAILTLDAPMRAEDAALVPISIKSSQPQQAHHRIKNIHLIIDNNPDPYAAKLTFSPTLENIDIATRVRVDRYTPIRAIAELNDGSLHMVSTFVKASGGCSAPAGKDAAAAQARFGQTQIRMRSPRVGHATMAQVMISHPNNTGLQIDQLSRGYIPAHYVTTMEIDFNEHRLMTIEAGISISEDPSLRFMFTPRNPGLLSVRIKDSKQLIFHAEHTI